MQDSKETRNAKIREIEAKLGQLDQSRKQLLTELGDLRRKMTMECSLQRHLAQCHKSASRIIFEILRKAPATSANFGNASGEKSIGSRSARK